jgi:hypothetical protein
MRCDDPDDVLPTDKLPGIRLLVVDRQPIMVHEDGRLVRLSGIQRTVCAAISLFMSESGHTPASGLTAVATAPTSVANEVIYPDSEDVGG